MNLAIFYNDVRPMFSGGRLTAGQVDGMGRILAEWQRRELAGIRWLSYMLATTFHETAQTMQPVREYGSESYLRSKPYYPWVGEGLVQVTWEHNAKMFGATAPGQLLNWDKALPALYDGMINGMFTGKRLSNYFSSSANDPFNARRIINGTDRAALVASYHREFLDALTKATS